MNKIKLIFYPVVMLLVIPLVIMFSVSVLSINAEAQSFGGDSFFQEDTGPEISYSGEVSTKYRSFQEDDDHFINDLQFNFDYTADKYDFSSLLEYNQGWEDSLKIREAYLNFYSDDYTFSLGKKRLVWGKGDQVHVVDQINAENLSDFINPDYLDRKVGEEMIQISKYLKDGRAKLEFVYTPDFTSHQLATNPDSKFGNWLMNPLDLTLIAGIKSRTGLTSAQLLDSALSAFPDYSGNDNDQYGLHFTDSINGIDYGLTYYHGRLRDPSYDGEVLKQIKSTLANPGVSIKPSQLKTYLDKLELHYDQVDMLGAEMATVIRGINTRAELAYFRTDDMAGNNPAVRNNKLAWVVGGDRDLPVHNLNINLQLTGEYILNNDQITKGDLQYNSDEDYLTSRAILQLSDSFQNEKYQPELNWVYNVDSNDYMLEAKLDQRIKNDIHLVVNHKIFSGDSGTEFGQFALNDFSSLQLIYSF